MLKNMAVHELALLVTFYGVTSANIAAVVPDKAYSSCQVGKLETPKGRHGLQAPNCPRLHARIPYSCLL
jgi:hypothetical protein